MKINRSLLGNLVFRGYSNERERGRVIFKTIVSTDLEARYVLMNVAENLDLVDHFLICEANISVLGENRDFSFSKQIAKYPELQDKKIQLIEMDLRGKALPWNGLRENLFANTFVIRDGFREIFPISPSDIVISTDGDEVIFSSAVRKFVRRLNRRILPRLGYHLLLNQIVYKLEYLWSDCGFRAPVVSRASVYLKQEAPQWRDKGTVTFRPSGTHFSWVMTAEEMKDKILNTAHRVEYEEFADVEVLQKAITDKKWIFHPERNFTVQEQAELTAPCYPRSLVTYQNLFMGHTDLVS